MEFLLISLGISSFLLFLYHLLCLWIPKLAKRTTGQARIAPVAAGAWPIIGHLHLLSGSQPPHKTLGSMADKYGPIFTINLGAHKVLIVSNSKIAKECYTTNDLTFATRPKFVAMEHMGYNYAFFAFGPYGPYWRKVRKIVAHHLLSNRRLEMLGYIKFSEIKASIIDTYEFWVSNKNASNMVKIEMKKWFGNLILNIVLRMLVGKRYSGDDEEEKCKSQKILRKFLEYLGMFVLSDAVPYLRWLDLGGYEKDMKKIGKEIESILEKWLEEHKRKRNLGKVMEGEQQDFMDIMVSILEGCSAEELEGFDADTVNKATCLAMLAGASDTTTVTLTWTLSLLLNNHHVFKKAQNELDIHVGRERQVEETDMKNLVYLQSIIKESLRLYPAVPIATPHESMEDCVLNGYNIPKGTRLLVNLSKIHRDPNVWADPDEFRPERFLTSHKDVDVKGQHFELIPFGSGRRICPGISLSLQIVQLILATLIHGFEITRPSVEPIDMTESVGLTNVKATPLEVLLTPRLSPNVYEQ